MLQTRIRYQTCHLHDQPLNYLCLHAKCSKDRIICAICKEERHSDYHMTMPLKIYLSHKAEQLKCLTKTKINLIQEQLRSLKEKTHRQLATMRNQVNSELTRLSQQCDNFLDQKFNTLRQCEKVINNRQFDVQSIQKIENILKIVVQHEQYEQQFHQKLNSVHQILENGLKDIRFERKQNKQLWIGHPNLQIIQNIMKSNDKEYKVAYLPKNISRSQSKVTFRAASSSRNWIGVGVCFGDIVKQRGFSFRYHTIGHGLYLISSNGGMWSHHKPEFNNKLGALTFCQKESIKVCFDFKDHKVIFENEAGQKFSMQVDQTQTTSLHYCAVLYYQQDIVQIVPELIIKN